MCTDVLTDNVFNKKRVYKHFKTLFNIFIWTFITAVEKTVDSQ